LRFHLDDEEKLLATYVLVHGGGHGGWCYQPVSRLLLAQGHNVSAPSLTGFGGRRGVHVDRQPLPYAADDHSDLLDVWARGWRTCRSSRNDAGAQAIRLYPEKPNHYNPVYEDDYVELGIRAVEIAATPPVVINWAGSETVSVEEYCAYMGELIGVEPIFHYSPDAHTPCGQTSR
jgi:hypothetical protein